MGSRCELARRTPRSTRCKQIRSSCGIPCRGSCASGFREDFPSKDPRFQKFTIVLRKGRDGQMEVHEEPIPEMPPELKAIIEEMK